MCNPTSYAQSFNNKQREHSAVEKDQHYSLTDTKSLINWTKESCGSHLKLNRYLLI